MSQLIKLERISLAFGHDPLLENADLQINKGERICLIGRNGAGKSSLLKIIEGSLVADGGKVWRKPESCIARLEQQVPENLTCSVFEYVASNLANVGQLLSEYHALTQKLSEHSTPKELQQLEHLQHAIDSNNGWQYEQTILSILTRLKLSPDIKLNQLSGGWQRRAAMAKALVTSPEVLLLDEPTNHLDIEAIAWLESYLLNCHIGLVFITHDRALLQRLATRIIELDRGQLTSWPGDYVNFLKQKEALLETEKKHHAEFDKKLAQEEKWVRQGVKARRTRNEGRVRALEALRKTRGQRREVEGRASFRLNDNSMEKSGKLVIEAKKVTQQYGNKTIIDNFSIRIVRGDRIALIGPNGVGKTTLLNLLLKKITPQSGMVRHGTNLEIVYFDQLRATLDPSKTVAENVNPGGEFIDIDGKKRHIISYLSDFLFSPSRSQTPVKLLSGGECNRVLMAQLFSQPSNTLVLDEPTNDLDIETLELLESLLCQYKGTLLVVSHDRSFLDNVVTSSLIFENNTIQETMGGYSDWRRQVQSTAANAIKKTKPVSINPSKMNKPEATREKLNYKETRELEALPKKIELLESEQRQLTEQSTNPQFYQSPPELITETMTRLSNINAELEATYQRWEELEQ